MTTKQLWCSLLNISCWTSRCFFRPSFDAEEWHRKISPPMRGSVLFQIMPAERSPKPWCWWLTVLVEGWRMVNDGCWFMAVACWLLWLKSWIFGLPIQWRSFAQTAAPPTAGGFAPAIATIGHHEPLTIVYHAWMPEFNHISIENHQPLATINHQQLFHHSPRPHRIPYLRTWHVTPGSKNSSDTSAHQ